MAKRSVSQRCLDPKPVEAGGRPDRAPADPWSSRGSRQETAKKIVKAVKDSKLKVQAQIQGDELRVTGKNRDDLQAAIALMRKERLRHRPAVRQLPRVAAPQRSSSPDIARAAPPRAALRSRRAWSHSEAPPAVLVVGLLRRPAATGAPATTSDRAAVAQAPTKPARAAIPARPAVAALADGETYVYAGRRRAGASLSRRRARPATGRRSRRTRGRPPSCRTARARTRSRTPTGRPSLELANDVLDADGNPAAPGRA